MNTETLVTQNDARQEIGQFLADEVTCGHIGFFAVKRFGKCSSELLVMSSVEVIVICFGIGDDSSLHGFLRVFLG